MKTKQFQKEFFDEQAVLYPWPNLLVKAGFTKNYKLRDVKFKEYLDLLGMKKGERVLDIGCGQGIFLARVVKTYQVDGCGVDISPNSIKAAKRWLSTWLHFRVADAAYLPFANESFDHVFSFDFLEHINEQKKVLAEMARVLKPGGGLLIYTINKNQRYTWNFCLNKLGVDVYRRVAHDSNLFLDPKELKKKLEKMGIGVEQLELFNSFFTLVFDEAIMLSLLIFRRWNFFGSSSSRHKVAVGQFFLKMANFFSRFLLPPLEMLEIPWKKRGYSNSFFILGRKR